MTDTEYEEAPRELLDVDEAIRETFGTFYANIVSFIFLGAIINLPLVVFEFVYFGSAAALHNTGNKLEPGTVELAVAMILSSVLGSLASAAICHGALDHIKGTRIGVGAMLMRGFSAFLPLMGATILVGLGTAFGMILLIIPGFIFLVMMTLYIPVIVAEGKGPYDSMARSRELTMGSRWRIFFVLTVVFMVSMIMHFALPLVSDIFGEVGAVVWALLSYGVGTGLIGALYAAMYAQLRANNEGVSIADHAG